MMSMLKYGRLKATKEFKMRVFEKVSVIKCSVEDLFDFHLDVKNLEIITPPDMKVELLSELTTPKVGDILRLKSTKGFISSVWEVEVKELVRPNLLLDEALKSPFKTFRHSHIFLEVDDGCCELRDVIEYELPFGFVGNLFDFVIRSEFKKMFEHRHRETKRILELNKG